MTVFDMNCLRPKDKFDPNSIFVSSEGKFDQYSQQLHGFVFKNDLEICGDPYQYGIHNGIGESLEDTSETIQQLNVLISYLQQTLQNIEILMICYVDGLRCFKMAIFNSLETWIGQRENNTEISTCYLDEAHRLKEDICRISDLQYQSAIDNIHNICSTAVIQNIADTINSNQNVNIPEVHGYVERYFYDFIGNDYLRSPEISRLRECLRQIYSQMMHIYRIVDDQTNQLERQNSSVAAIELSMENLVLDSPGNDEILLENQKRLRQMDCLLTQIFGLSRDQS